MMFGLSSIQMAIYGFIAAVVLGLGVTLWDAERALRREHDRAIKAERDLTAVMITLEKERADARARRDSDARIGLLPGDRVRLCAVRGPTSGCCTQIGKCEP